MSYSLPQILTYYNLPVCKSMDFLMLFVTIYLLKKVWSDGYKHITREYILLKRTLMRNFWLKFVIIIQNTLGVGGKHLSC